MRAPPAPTRPCGLFRRLCLLEYAVEFIADDELVEATPQSIRIRKRFLKDHERKKASREAA